VVVTQLSFGGILAVQIPDSLYEPNRALLRMVAADGPWAKKLLPVAKTRPFNEMMEGVYGLLCPVCVSVEIWKTTYLYPVKGIGAIIDLMKATSLAPFFARTRGTFAQAVPRSLCHRTDEGISSTARWQGPSAAAEDFCVGAAIVGSPPPHPGEAP
jgi:trans-aconitate 2-methyltransferase